MISKPVLPVIVLLVVTTLLGACSRQTLYDKAIDWERSGAGLEESTVQLNGITIAYLQNVDPVDGQTIVLIHGFGANKDNWLRMAGHLSDEFNIYALDLPGHGDSTKDLDLGYSISDQVSYVKAVMTELELGPVHMMGNSMGGAITAQYAYTYPENILTAVLFDPAGVFEFDSELVELVKQGENPLIVEKPGDFERLVDFALEKKPFLPWPIFSVMEERAIANRQVNERIFAAIRDSGYQPGFRDALERIEAPVLVVWGEKDRITDARNAAVFVERIPDARLELLEDVGHAPMIEVPERSANLVREFIAEQRNQTQPAH